MTVSFSKSINRTQKLVVGEMAYQVKCPQHTHWNLGSDPQHPNKKELSMLMHACNPIIEETEIGRSTDPQRFPGRQSRQVVRAWSVKNSLSKDKVKTY